MKFFRTAVVLFAILFTLSNFSQTQAQVEENQIYLPIILNNYRFRSETVYVREETVQHFSRKMSLGMSLSDRWMGIVHNDSSQTKKYIVIEVQYYNSDNQLIGRQTGSVSGAVPSDGDRCFEIYIDPPNFLEICEGILSNFLIF